MQPAIIQKSNTTALKEKKKGKPWEFAAPTV